MKEQQGLNIVGSPLPKNYNALLIQGGELKQYRCDKGHTWEAATPFSVYCTDDQDYGSGPLCCYCYVDFHRANFQAEIIA